MGYQDGEHLAKSFASADIFAFPSLTETFGNVVLEALASGLPVVGLRAEGVCDLVIHEETGLLLDLADLVPVDSQPLKSKDIPDRPPGLFNLDPPAYAIAVSLYRSLLLDLVTKPEKRREMSTLAIAHASKRTWFEGMELLVDGYRELAQLTHQRRKLSDPITAPEVILPIDHEIVIRSTWRIGRILKSTPRPWRRSRQRKSSTGGVTWIATRKWFTNRDLLVDQSDGLMLDDRKLRTWLGISAGNVARSLLAIWMIWQGYIVISKHCCIEYQ